MLVPDNTGGMKLNLNEYNENSLFCKKTFYKFNEMTNGAGRKEFRPLLL